MAMKRIIYEVCQYFVEFDSDEDPDSAENFFAEEEKLFHNKYHTQDSNHDNEPIYDVHFTDASPTIDKTPAITDCLHDF